MNTTEACIALNMSRKWGRCVCANCSKFLETPERILSAKRGELRAVEGIGNEVAEQIANWENIG